MKKMEDSWPWKTHQPMIHTTMTLFKPQLVVELGMGFFSTPLFMKYNPTELVCVEYIQGWIDLLKGRLMFKENHKVLFHDLGSGNLDAIDISKERKALVFSRCIQLRDSLNKKLTPRLLFIDGVRCSREISLQILHPLFDIILYHDFQYEIYQRYYKQLKGSFDLYVLKTPRSWTGCFIRKEMPYTEDKLFAAVNPFISLFEMQNPGTTNIMQLQRMNI